MKKNKLEIDYDYDFDLIGIVSTAREYKLAWHINKVLGISLSKRDDIVISMNNEETLSISNLLAETTHNTLRLIENQSINKQSGSSTTLFGDDKLDSKAMILPELPNFTHFFMIEGDGVDFESSEMIDKLKEIPVVQYITSIEPEKLKNKDNLIF